MPLHIFEVSSIHPRALQPVVEVRPVIMFVSKLFYSALSTFSVATPENSASISSYKFLPFHLKSFTNINSLLINIIRPAIKARSGVVVKALR